MLYKYKTKQKNTNKSVYGTVSVWFSAYLLWRHNVGYNRINYVCFFFRINMSIQGQESPEKKYDPLDKTLKFVNRGDDLDPVCKISLFLWLSTKTAGHAKVAQGKRKLSSCFGPQIRQEKCKCNVMHHIQF